MLFCSNICSVSSSWLVVKLIEVTLAGFKFYLFVLFNTLISLFELLLLREKVVIDLSKMKTSSTLSYEARKLLKASFFRSRSDSVSPSVSTSRP